MLKVLFDSIIIRKNHIIINDRLLYVLQLIQLRLYNNSYKYIGMLKEG